jgi:hypothetical protein
MFTKQLVGGQVLFAENTKLGQVKLEKWQAEHLEIH